jgi:tetratricopeptide (TPR) repeat protein
MAMSTRFRVASVAFVGLLSAAGAAGADVTIIGNGLAAECSTAARGVANNAPARTDAEHECTLAIEGEPLSPHEAAATYVNRGVLYLTDRAIADARRDFEQALKIEPNLPEAMVDRGAALIAGGHDRDGVDEITRGLLRNPIQPEEAYYNRAVAEERLGDVRSAYFDFRKAGDLKPDWPLPKTELARFTVKAP